MDQLVHWLAYGSLAVGATSAYLQLNKLWSRKHIPEVAESISISGVLLEAVPYIFFCLYFTTTGDHVGLFDNLIWLLAAIGSIMVGPGFWVKGKRKNSLVQLAWASLKRESDELGNLMKSLLARESNEELIQLLHTVAEVDGEVSVDEALLINKVAENMHLDIHLTPRKCSDSRSMRLLNTKNALEAFLLKSPPNAQVESLVHLLHKLALSDGRQHEDELASLEELQGRLRSYLEVSDEHAPFQVLLAPQSEAQIKKILSLLSDAIMHDRAGGQGVTVGEFHTREFATAICQEYRELGFFCVVIDEPRAA